MNENEINALVKINTLITEAFEKGVEIGKKFHSEESDDKFVKTNLNSYIKTKLNDKGLAIYHDYWKNIFGKSYDENSKHLTIPMDAEGYCKFQIHEFMNIFGQHCAMGNLPFCENNTIWFEKSE